jgi:hypothetical protein
VPAPRGDFSAARFEVRRFRIGGGDPARNIPAPRIIATSPERTRVRALGRLGGGGAFFLIGH